MMAEREERMRLIQTVDLGAIRRNVRAVRSKTRTRVLVMVKADAYGHGMTEVARSLATRRTIWGSLRSKRGKNCAKTELKPLLWSRYARPTVWLGRRRQGLRRQSRDEETLRALVAVPQCMRPAFHLKFDTGMHRLGLPAEDAGEGDRPPCGARRRARGSLFHFREPDARQLDVFLSAAGKE